MMEATSRCIVCGKESALVCSACLAVCYCSRDHQVAHWKEHHKINCSGNNYKVEWDANIGHHLVAKKNLEAGSIILKELPLMIGTNLREPKEKVCLGCYKTLDGQGVVCPGCNWPMCGKRGCWGKGSDHALGECSLLKGFQERIPSKNLDLLELPDLYMSISVLRVLALRNRDPVKWGKIMKLKHCVSSLRLSELKSGIQVKIVKLVNDSLLAVAVPEDWIFKICLAFALNCFELTESQVIYSTASLIDHNCLANAEHTFTKIGGKILVRATVPIIKGARITLNYSKNILLGTMKRREHLKGSSRFSEGCRCPRCCDPAELGTFTNGIYCAKCPSRKGILLPENPLEDESSWICNNCSDEKSAAFVTKLLDEDGIRLVHRTDVNVAELEAYILKWGQVLYQNHFFLTAAKMHLRLALGLASVTTAFSTAGKSRIKLKRASDQELNERETEILKLLELADVVSPGWTRLRGTVLSLLSIVRVNRLLEHLEVRNSGFSAIAGQSLRADMVTQTLRQACEILRWGQEEIIEDEKLSRLNEIVFVMLDLVENMPISS